MYETEEMKRAGLQALHLLVAADALPLSLEVGLSQVAVTVDFHKGDEDRYGRCVDLLDALGMIESVDRCTDELNDALSFETLTVAGGMLHVTSARGCTPVSDRQAARDGGYHVPAPGSTEEAATPIARLAAVTAPGPVLNHEEEASVRTLAESLVACGAEGLGESILALLDAVQPSNVLPFLRPAPVPA